MPSGQRAIFVLDIRHEAAFAFEAESLAQAEGLTHAPWFTSAIDEFCARKRRCRGDAAARRIRPATEREASTYRDYADEFSDAWDQFLIAHLSDVDQVAAERAACERS